MDKSQENEIRELLVSEIEKTTKAVADYKELAKPIAPENSIGRISRMDAINNKSITEAALRTAQIKLKGLQFAIQKLGSADFGICARCKTEIPIQRILRVPHSTLCVRCSS